MVLSQSMWAVGSHFVRNLKGLWFSNFCGSLGILGGALGGSLRGEREWLGKAAYRHLSKSAFTYVCFVY